MSERSRRVRTANAGRPLHVLMHRLTRELAKCRTIEAIGAVLLRHVVKAVPSRLAAFAVPSESGEPQIVATHGYDLAQPQDIRLAPCAGVIRTNAVLSVPALSGATITCVACLTDRLDGRAFDREDASVLRALMAPAGLAILRARAEAQALAFARAATIDPVSGLFNRRYFHARLDEELERSVRQHTPVVLLMIDVDDFKRINDDHGHPVGDTVIRDVSDILKRSVRLFDICTRFGGEEFAVLMPNASAEDAVRIAERIRQHIERYCPAGPGLDGLSVTVSIGLAVAGSLSAQELIDEADRALYRAKRAGKNRIEQHVDAGSSRPAKNSLGQQTLGAGR